MNVRRDTTESNVGDTPEYTGINIDMLSGVIRAQPNNNVKVSNSDASLLFKFWQEAKPIKQGRVESMQVPEKFSNNDILRLKALGFVVGDDTEVVKLTQRARGIIKSIVLSEENSFESTRVHKPYNEILADSNKANNGIRLALDEKK
jgi:hypothetical protein